MKIHALAFLPVALLLLAGCGGKFSSTTETVFNPRDTVQVPDYLSGEDSIAYIEDVIVQSPISAEDLLGLAEVRCYVKYQGTHRDSAAVRLANRLLRMHDLVDRNGDASDKLQWAAAVNVALDTFRVAVPSLVPDSAIDEIVRVIEKFSSLTQMEMNRTAWTDALVEYYRTIEYYRKWLGEVPANLKPLMKEEYEAWHDLNEARFMFWNHVSYNCIGYSMRTMETAAYYSVLAENRRAELATERDIVLSAKPYHQKGKTVSKQQWEEWISKSSLPEDYDIIKECGEEDRLPTDSLVACHVDGLRTTFTRWLSARQTITAALPEEQGRSYDNMTADIHSRFIGNLEWIVPFDPY